jgi:hypothetical protein
VVNHNGELKWALGGNFRTTCEDIQLSANGFSLSCVAMQEDGNKIAATLDLTERIQNNDGELVIDI